MSRKPLPVWLPVVLILLLGFALRLYRIEGQPLSGDEAYSAVVWVQSSPATLLNSIALATTEPHPPLALLTLHYWAWLAGDSILALRLFATLASLVTIAAVYAIARRLGGRMAALLATLLCALNPFQLWYAQFARNYSLWMAASAVTVLLLLHAWRKPERPARWVPYILSAVFTGYVFYLEAFLLVAHNLFALAKVRLSESGRRLRLLLIWAITQASIAAALAPWYLRPELFLNSREYEPNGEPANILWAIQSFLLGDTLPPPLQHPLIIQPEHSLGIASAIASFMVIVSLVLIWRTARRETFYFLAAYSLTPLAILTGLTLITGRRYFHPRYIAASSTAFILVVAFGLEGLTELPRPSLSLRRGLSMVGAGTIAALSLVGLWNYHFNPAFSKGPEWVRIMETLNDQATPHDLIIFNYPDPAFEYYTTHYFEGQARHVVMPSSRNAPYDRVAAELAALTGGYDYIWFMPVPNDAWDAEQNVARWLEGEKQLISDQWIGVTRLYQYADWQPSERQIAHRRVAQFGSLARLEGYRLTPPVDHWQPGTTVYVELFWRPTARAAESLKVFLHLLGPVGPDGGILWAQDDRYPQGGRVSTQTWEPDSLLRDVYRLDIPSDAPPGEYTVAVGFYDPRTGERISLENPGAADGSDYAAVFTLTLR